jgi:hypothetical protein
LLVFGQLAKVAGQKEGMSLEQLQSFENNTKEASELTEEDRKALEALFVLNKKDDLNYQSPENLAAGLAEFRADLQPGSGTTVHQYEFNGQLAAFIKTKRVNDQTLYVGSFNAHPEVRGIVPQKLADQIIEAYGKDYDLIADAVQGSATERWYRQQFGFIPTGKTEQFGTITYAQLKRPKGS